MEKIIEEIQKEKKDQEEEEVVKHALLRRAKRLDSNTIKHVFAGIEES